MTTITQFNYKSYWNRINSVKFLEVDAAVLNVIRATEDNATRARLSLEWLKAGNEATKPFIIAAGCTKENIDRAISTYTPDTNIKIALLTNEVREAWSLANRARLLASTRLNIKPNATTDKVMKLSDVRFFEEEAEEAEKLLAAARTTTAPIIVAQASGYNRVRPVAHDTANELTGISAADLAEFDDFLDELTSQDAYDVETATSGTISEQDYMHVPAALIGKFKNLPPEHVGFQCVRLPPRDFIELVAVNYEASGKTDVDLKVAFLRAHLCTLGYCNLDTFDKVRFVKTSEVTIVKTKAAEESVKAIKKFMTEDQATIKKLHALAQIAPVFMSEVFIKTGTHYVADPQAEWSNNYIKLFNSSLMSSYANIIPIPVLFHRAIHWIGPYTCRLAWANLKNTPALPLALKLRFDVAPAGTAIITTTAAILRSLKNFSFYDDIALAYGADTNLLSSYADYIRANSTKFFTMPEVFGVRGLNAVERDRLDRMKELAKKLCVVCQAYIEAVARNTALGKAKALKKYADEMPMQKKALVTWFKNYATQVASAETLLEILAMTPSA